MSCWDEISYSIQARFMNSAIIAAHWSRFVASQRSGDAPEKPYDAAQFGNTTSLADTLGRLIVVGRKTASCSALWEYEADDESLPTPGKRAIVLDGREVPLCIIET